MNDYDRGYQMGYLLGMLNTILKQLPSNGSSARIISAAYECSITPGELEEARQTRREK